MSDHPKDWATDETHQSAALRTDDAIVIGPSQLRLFLSLLFCVFSVAVGVAFMTGEGVEAKLFGAVISVWSALVAFIYATMLWARHRWVIKADCFQGVTGEAKVFEEVRFDNCELADDVVDTRHSLGQDEPWLIRLFLGPLIWLHSLLYFVPQVGIGVRLRDAKSYDQTWPARVSARRRFRQKHSIDVFIPVGNSLNEARDMLERVRRRIEPFRGVRGLVDGRGIAQE
jgi:hypothetical protein